MLLLSFYTVIITLYFDLYLVYRHPFIIIKQTTTSYA
nr:MAG TPA: hypothetical protein [Caudoviricetes sp.]